MDIQNLFRKLILLPLLASPLAALADPVYALTFLPPNFGASNINNAGRIVGTFGNAAAVWSDTGITDISAIAPGSLGQGISNNGALAGSWQGSAFVYRSGVFRDIGPLGPWSFSNAAAVNDAGQVAGNGGYPVGERANGFVYSAGVVRIIPTFGGDWSYAAAINSSGQVAGIATIDSTNFINPTRHAIIYQDSTTQDLGTLGNGVISEGYDINDAGQVVGMSSTTTDQDMYDPHAFLYANGAMGDLGFLGGHRARALGLNNAGLVVGESEWSNDREFDFHAFLYARHMMVDLNDLIDPASGWKIVSAKDINDSQQILATACRLGECSWVRLDLIPAVPEPQAWAMLLAGLAGLALVGFRRRKR